MADCDTKVCAACGQEKATTQFHRNSRMSDGLRSSCKPCVLAINRKSVLKHHEKRKAEKRAVYQVLKDTPDYQAYVKAYQAATKEEKRRYDKEYSRKNRAKIAKRAAEWNKRNPQKRRAISIAYHSRRRCQEVGGVSTADLSEWRESQKKTCYWCGVKCADNFHVDHYVPLSKGGKHELDNLVIACGPCNLKKNAKDPFDFAQEVGRLF